MSSEPHDFTVSCVGKWRPRPESPYQRCHPRLCRRSPPSQLSFVHSRARFWRSWNTRGEWSNANWYYCYQNICNSIPNCMTCFTCCLAIWYWSGMIFTSTCSRPKANATVFLLRFSYRQHRNRSAAWTCCSNLKLRAAQAWILDMKRIYGQNLVSIHWTATSSQRFGLPWIYLNQSLPPKWELKGKCVSTFHCRTCKSSKISFSLSPRVFAFGPIAIHDLHKYFRTKLSHSVNLFDSLWIES